MSEKIALFNWMVQSGFEPWSFLTFTFKEEAVIPDTARGLLKDWLDDVNTFVMGKHYKRHFKHCYFSYIYTEEYQARGTIHFHMLVDNAIPYKLCKQVWSRHGLLYITRVKNPPAAINYLLKYVTKGPGDVVTWLLKQPKPYVKFASIHKQSIPKRPVEDIALSRVSSESVVEVSREGLSEGRGNQLSLELQFQPDLDNPMTARNTHNWGEKVRK